MIGHHTYLITINANNSTTQVNQLTMTHLDHIARHKIVRLVQRGLTKHCSRFGINTVGRLFESLQLDQGGLDALGEHGTQWEIFDEEAFGVVAIVLKDPHVLLFHWHAAHGLYALGVEQLRLGTNFSLEIQLLYFVLDFKMSQV